MDPIIKELAHKIIRHLEQLEQQTAFHYLCQVEDPGLRREAVKVHQELLQMKTILNDLC